MLLYHNTIYLYVRLFTTPSALCRVPKPLHITTGVLFLSFLLYCEQRSSLLLDLNTENM